MGNHLLSAMLLLICFLGLGDNAKAQFKYTEVLSLPIRVIVFNKAGWHNYEILPRIAHANRVLSQCGIQVKVNEISYLDVSSSQFDVNLDGAQNKLTETGHIYPTNGKITLFYVRSSNPQQAAFSIRPSNTSAGVTDELRGSVWLTVYTKFIEAYIDEHSSTEAHEIGHVLLDQSHISGLEKNFLHGDPKLLSDRINPDQCEKIRASPYFNEKTASQDN